MVKMSTRSGKRIHSSFHEGTTKAEEELALRSERKTRSKRLKENDTQLDMNLPKSKKHTNYVSYPTDDESNTQTMVAETGKVENPRKLRRNTLKDHNCAAPVIETLYSDVEVKNGRKTRRTKKATENCDDILENAVSVEIVVKKKLKKSKKNKKKCGDVTEPANGPVEALPVKKLKRKKKGKRSNSITKESHVKNKSLNKSASLDSFHSAAGSPMKDSSIRDSLNNNPAVVNLSAECEKLDSTYEKNEPTADPTDSKSTSDKKKKRKSSIKNSTFDKIPSHTPTLMLYDAVEATDKLNTTYEKEPSEAKTKRDTFNKTLETSNKKKSKTVSLNSTYDKNEEEETECVNTTFELEPTVQISTNGNPEILNNTFDKTPKKHSNIISLNSTYDKEANTKLDTTFDKSNSKSDSVKSSLISSDATINVTFDKCNENSRISMTSDDSKTENIINTTPVLIESSMDESQISNTATQICAEIFNVTPKQSIDSSKAADIKPPPSILREGTFTKDSPVVLVSSPKSKISMERTPTRRMTLPSPGFTPFHTSRSSQMEKSVLNVTRSIEKSLRRSSLVELMPRQTKVMFCSPVNNTAVAMQQTRKVIKSSMKGSNKSFVFDESVGARGTRGAGAARKRSLTQNDAEDARAHAKRSRLAPDELQHSIDRLSRPRTSSAAAKLSEATPAKKPATPSTSKSSAKPTRTKLPNFAALHQRRFDKMESLGECQERKKKRARQLLTPTGGVVVLERSSPRSTIEPLKETQMTPKKEVATPKDTTAQKTVPASKTLPTLESLRPGYTRFGFKMNIGVNPFSVPGKNENRKENKPNGVANKKESTVKKANGLPKVALKPSSAGATSTRREVAKQTVMREKSFASLSDKRDVKRKENRTIIKGVRTNRRFDLQMKMRDIN